MRIRGQEGFSLIELMVAMGLSLFVMGTIIMISTSSMRNQLDSTRKGSVTGATLYGLVRMQRELEDSTYLNILSPGPYIGDILTGCSNWSMVNTGSDKRLDKSPSASVTAFCYCVSGAALLRYSAIAANSCNLAALASCTTPGSCGGGSPETVVYSKPGFYRQSNWNYFVRSNDVSGITLHGNVGSPTSTAQNPNPSFFKIDTHMSMAKSYNNTLD